LAKPFPRRLALSWSQPLKTVLLLALTRAVKPADMIPHRAGHQPFVEGACLDQA